MPNDNNSRKLHAGAEASAAGTVDQALFDLEMPMPTRAGELSHDGVVGPSNAPEVPPWIESFIAFYRERFGELLILPESGTPNPSSVQIADEPRSALTYEAPQNTANTQTTHTRPALAVGREWTLAKHALSSRVKRLLAYFRFTVTKTASSPPRRLWPIHPSDPAQETLGTSPGLEDPSSSENTLPEQHDVDTLPNHHSLKAHLLPTLLIVILVIAGLTTHVVKGNRDHTPNTSRRILETPAPVQQQQTVSSNLQPASDNNTEPVTVTAIQHSSASHSTTLVIGLSGTVSYTVNRVSGPERIYIDFNHSRPSLRLNGKAFTVAEPCLHKYRLAARNSDVTRVTFETDQLCDYSATLVPNPYRLLVGLQPHHARQ